MAVVQLADIIQPEYFAEYMANNSMASTTPLQSGVLASNALMQAQRRLPLWRAMFWQSTTPHNSHPHQPSYFPATFANTGPASPSSITV